jgi:hypothetical protein
MEYGVLTVHLKNNTRKGVLQMESHSGIIVARLITLLCLLMLIGTFIPSVAAVKGGEDIEVDVSNSPMMWIEHSTNLPDLSNWVITVKLNSNASDNGTTVKILRQMCTNEGVCFAPEFVDVSSSDENSSWASSWQTIDDHAYVNWKVTLNYTDGEEETWPKSGEYAKAWSDCWYDINNDIWGGEGCEAIAVPLDRDGNDDGLPSISFLATMAMMALAARKVRSK